MALLDTNLYPTELAVLLDSSSKRQEGNEILEGEGHIC